MPPDSALKLSLVHGTAGGFSLGYRKHWRALVPALRAHPRIARVDLVVPPGSPAALVEGMENVLPWKGSLRGTVEGSAPDVVLIPTARWTDFGGVPTVIMVRNMEPFFPGAHGGSPLLALKNFLRRRQASRACRKATRIIAVSRFVADVLRDRLGTPKEKIGVVYHGVEPSCEEAVPGGMTGLETGSFHFTAGSLRPHRGIEDLLAALPILRARGMRIPLVVAGAPDPDSRGYALSLKERTGAEDVRWLGSVGEREMAWCYRRCSAFVMTSRVESCPNTALEAMSHGCRIVSTNSPPMPEIFGPAADYYVPGDAAALAALLEGAADRRALARERAREFTWAVAADRLARELESAVKAPSGSAPASPGDPGPRTSA